MVFMQLDIMEMTLYIISWADVKCGAVVKAAALRSCDLEYSK